MKRASPSPRRRKPDGVIDIVNIPVLILHGGGHSKGILPILLLNLGHLDGLGDAVHVDIEGLPGQVLVGLEFLGELGVKDKYTVTKQGETKTVDSVDEIAGTYTSMLQDSVKKAFGDKLKMVLVTPSTLMLKDFPDRYS